MELVGVRRRHGPGGVRWLVTGLVPEAVPGRRFITYEVLGEARPDARIVGDQLWITADGKLWMDGICAEAAPLRYWYEVDVPQNDLLRAAFDEQAQTLQHNQLVDALRTVLGTLAVSVASAFVMWRLLAMRR